MKIIILLFISFNLYANVCDSIYQDTSFLSSDDTSHQMSRDFISKKLKDLGYNVKLQTFPSGQNIIATTSNTPKLILSAHYDRLSKCTQRDDSLTRNCSGATDDSAGVALVLALASEFSDIAIIIFDAEEEGLLGSKYFVNNPTFSLKEVKAMFNFDIIGLNLYEELSFHTLSMGSETGGRKLTQDVLDSFYKSGLAMHPFTYSLTQNRADIAPFINNKIRIPTVHFTDGDGSIYHTSSDEVEFVNFKKITRMKTALTYLIKKVLISKYSYRRPSFFKGIALPKKTDVKVALNLLEQTPKNYDLSQKLEELKRGIFSPKKMLKFNNIAREFISRSANQEVLPLGQMCEK